MRGRRARGRLRGERASSMATRVQLEPYVFVVWYSVGSAQASTSSPRHTLYVFLGEEQE